MDEPATAHQAPPAEGPPPSRPENGPRKSERPDLDVAIVGGGPGGLAAANAILAARPDLRVAVFERSRLRPRGASVMMQPNGIAALEAISPKLAEGVMALDSHLGPCWLYSADGMLMSLRDGKDSPLEVMRQCGGRNATVTWHELQALLAHALPQGVLHQETAVARVEESGSCGSPVTLHFLDGRPPLTAHLLVGADGGQSAVRQLLLGDGQPVYTGAAVWRAVMPKPTWWPSQAGSTCLFGSPPNIMAAVELGDGSVAWEAFANWPAERLEEIGGGRANYVQDPAAKKEQGQARQQRALEVYGGWCLQVRSLIMDADPLALTEHGQFYRLPDACNVWGRGAITLLGDSAHLCTPFLGQGTNQAFEDAVELGRAIGMHGVTPEALREYERIRHPQAEVVQRASVEGFIAFKDEQKRGKLLQHTKLDQLGVWQRTFAALHCPGSLAT